MDIKTSKQRFGIIGNNILLNRAIKVALQVAKTDISVLISGESGTGKETIPQIIHHNSNRKHNNFIAVNCGAIPEGTIDSELFGHEKGAFTGANETRKGYFEAANNGTIFLDEIGELPLSSQVRLLRILENGEYIKVGSSKSQKTNVRIIAATNINMQENVKKGKFREDLYYRLNTISIHLPPLRKRKDDINLLFRKFANDFAEKSHLPENISTTPAIFNDEEKADISEREILYKVLFDMKKDLRDLKKITYNLINDNQNNNSKESTKDIFNEIKDTAPNEVMKEQNIIEIEENLSLMQQEKKLIIKALNKHKDRRKDAAKELGISERTLYRKIKEFEI